VRELAVVNSGGLGGFFYTTTDGQGPLVCGQFEAPYFLNPQCWGDSFANFQTAFYGTAPGGPNNLTMATPIVPKAPDIVYTNPNQVVPDTTGQTSQDLSNAAIAATQALNASLNPPPTTPPDFCQTLSANWPYPFDDIPCSSMLLYGAIAAVGLMFLFGRFK
jgi:hypothetical protein